MKTKTQTPKILKSFSIKLSAEKALKAFVDVVTEELTKGEKIQLVGFGTFEVSERADGNCCPS